jgi:hypothetical protein
MIWMSAATVVHQLRSRMLGGEILDVADPWDALGAQAARDGGADT